tara:strand:+ start:997 stop:1509 length:513 start_codon:yes stop_codon:yes gene_type:complete
MAANEHKNLLDGNRHNPMGFEGAQNNSFLGKTNGTGSVSSDGNLVWMRVRKCYVLSYGTISTTCAVAPNADYMRLPYGFRLTGVRASLFTAADDIVTVDILEEGVSVLSTLLTIDATEKTSTTAEAAAVISDAELLDDAQITIDITTIGGGGNEGVGLKVYLIGHTVENY